MTDNKFIENLFDLFRIKMSEGIKYISFEEEKEVIEVDRVRELFNEIERIPENKFTIYYNEEGIEVAEVAVSIEYVQQRRLFGEGTHRKIEDGDNKVNYEIGFEVSDYYIVWLYKKLFEKIPNEIKLEIKRRVYFALTGGRNRFRKEIGDAKDISLLHIMRSAIKCVTLKVRKEKTTKINLEEAIDSFSYTYMCNMHSPIKIYSIEDVFGVLNRQKRAQRNDFQAPKRKYNSNLIDYYNLAISSRDPFISFISYYHIIEYFFDEVYREHQINTLRTSITSPRFSYKDDNELFKIIKKIINDNRHVKENGSGNEQRSLNYVLNKFLHDLDEFKQRLDTDELNFYQNNSVSFSAGDVINWEKNDDKIIKAISNRVYKTRNALIHSKSSKKDVTYHPYLHKTELEKEISLIKAIAESIIENNSELLR
ncbi:hypothetical protein [Bacillus subtilis]|uniref:hypothetical protein n=1 Tax=Bacillus subtilis TaxID=1423 RepID=UPI0004A5849C|nr:hypothetical protein [Bacillus subtilis]CCU58561.1 hypothetical protein BSUBE1_1930 [Bacillus subtilis E1]